MTENNRLFYKTWTVLLIIYLAPIIIDLSDYEDQIFRNVVWFLYIIPTLMCVYLKGIKLGFISIALSQFVFYLVESLQPGGFVKHDIIVFIELLVVNVLITFVVGILFKRNKENQLQLEKTKDFMENIFHNLDIGIWSFDTVSNDLIFSKGIERIYGFDQEREKPDNFWRNTVYSEDLCVIKEIDQKWERKESYEFEYRIYNVNGEIRWIRDQGIPVFNKEGSLVRYDGTNVDITNKKQLEIALTESQEKYKYLVEKSLVGIFLIKNYELVYVNNWFSATLGISKEELLGNKFLRYIKFKNAHDYYRQFKQLREGKIPFVKDEIQFITNSGEIKFLEIQASQSSINHELGVIGIVVDITDKKKALSEIEYIAFHDPLTGVFNMNYLHSFLEKDEQKRHASTIMCLNLDRFKLINDSYGHQTGDLLLKAVAKRLVQLTQQAGKVIHSGGDEFILYLPQADESQVKGLATLIIKEFLKPIYLEEHEILIAVSIGIYLMQPEDNLDEALKKASSTLHFAKESGRNQFQFYSAEFGQKISRRFLIEQRLRKALEQEIFQLYYQPKIDLDTNQITGMEALIRWNDPVLGTLSPAEFIPIAEETGIIIPLGKWILETACKSNNQFQKQGNSLLHVCVNISSRQFLQDDFVSMVKQILNDSMLPPQYLNLEVTEGIALYSIDDTVKKLEQLKQLGVSISLDDFGTGYSSLSYLKFLPIDYLKIDRSFINEIKGNHDAAIIHSTISLAHSLGLKVVAEGVEYEDQQLKLKDMGCDEIQGYYYAKPMPSSEFKRYLEVK